MSANLPNSVGAKAVLESIHRGEGERLGDLAGAISGARWAIRSHT
jgi:hypothetical protein